MSKKVRLFSSYFWKLRKAVIVKYPNGSCTVNSISQEYGIFKATIKTWG